MVYLKITSLKFRKQHIVVIRFKLQEKDLNGKMYLLKEEMIFFMLRNTC
jgi:hypothetical protein